MLLDLLLVGGGLTVLDGTAADPPADSLPNFRLLMQIICSYYIGIWLIMQVIFHFCSI